MFFHYLLVKLNNYLQTYLLSSLKFPYWICLKCGYTCTLMPPENVVGSGADAPVVVGGCEWKNYFDRLPCGVQALLSGTPRCQGEDLPSFQRPGRPMLVCVYLFLGRKADGKGGLCLSHFIQEPQFSATSTQTPCPVLQSEQE